MTLKVFKYPVSESSDYFELAMPRGARVLHADMQDGMLCIWALVNATNSPTERRVFRWAGTGHPIEQAPEKLVHISSILAHGGKLVWHIFEVLQ